MAKRRRKRSSGSGSGPSRIRSRTKRGITTAGSKVRKAVRRRSADNTSESSSNRRTIRSAPPAANTRDKQRTKPKLDIGKGRLVYPSKGDDGRVRYLPRESEATSDEIKKGLYIRMARKDAKQIETGISRKFDVGKGRFIYPVKDANGKVSYLPRESEASKIERENGAFVKNTEVVQKVAENLKARYDVGKSRYVFPVEGANKKIEYLPKRGDANKFELSNGLFVRDEDVQGMEPREERRIRRVSRLSKKKPEQPATDDQGRRNLKTRPIPAAKDGTELWNLKDIPDISIEKERTLLKTLKPKYDLGKGRMIYPVLNEKGKTIYLPLKNEANKKELKEGLFADFVPKDGMPKFISDNMTKNEIEVEGGKIKAITEEDLRSALDKLNDLVLRPHKEVIETLQNNVAVQQEWV